MTLAKGEALTSERIDEYETFLTATGAQVQLPWMLPWLRFLVYYRQYAYEPAWACIVEAFDSAKYCAGSKQYEIVNHYIEVAAKLGKRREFTKGVHWARYLGHPVRWLRDKDPTKQNLDFVMEMMSRARYGV